MELRKNRHSVYKLNYHLIIVIKKRRKLLTPAIGEELRNIVIKIVEEKWGCVISEFGFESDHIHIAFEAPPQVQLSKLVNSIKTASGKRLRNCFPELKRFDSLWSPSYCLLSTGGAPVDIVKRYISEQKGDPANPS